MTTDSKVVLESVVGPTQALEVTGTQADLNELLRAIDAAVCCPDGQEPRAFPLHSLVRRCSSQPVTCVAASERLYVRSGAPIVSTATMGTSMLNVQPTPGRLTT